MSLFLGVDTGGTYTDAVLIKDDKHVLAAAKSLTTREDLAIGIAGAVARVLQEAAVAPAQVDLAALSTTLATNALVEGQGGRVALIYIGFPKGDLDRHGLADALRGDPRLVCAGGHDHAGQESAALDEEAIRFFCAEHGGSVSAFAVASRFATRNAAHEQQVAATVAAWTGRPVSASHQLSAKLNGPKRALTALLNARLIGLIDRLIQQAGERLGALGIDAPLMVVRGDGALISAEAARHQPIETILSGPAASLVGARWLTGAEDALVSDIGGTTTDVALLRGGRPAIDPAGAKVGPFRTMVEAVAMRTTGLGGDSEVHLGTEGLTAQITLGPRRALPVSLLATEAPEAVHAELDSQLRRTTPSEQDARFLRRVPNMPADGVSGRDAALLERIGNEVHPVEAVVRARLDLAAMTRLAQRGLVQIAAPTPSDASHVLGLAGFWDRDAAEKALTLLARRRSGAGEVFAPGAADFARLVVDALTAQTRDALLEVALAEDPLATGETPEALARHPLLRRGLAGHRGLLQLDAALAVPVIGLGASAATYYPAVGAALCAKMEVPKHAEVANAIGAVVGQIIASHSGTVTGAANDVFRAYVPGAAPQDFTDLAAAEAYLDSTLQAQVTKDLEAQGAVDIRLSQHKDVKSAQIEGREVFIEATLYVEGAGRPGIARDTAAQG